MPFRAAQSHSVWEVAQARVHGSAAAEASVVVLEFAQELLLSHFPITVVRAVIHSVAPSAATIAARGAVRILQRMGGPRRHGGGPAQGASGGGGFRKHSAGGRRGHGGTRGGGRPKHRSRSSSRSSSSTSSGYAKYKAQRAAEKETAKARRQGEALEAALDARFQELGAALGGGAAVHSAPGGRLGGGSPGPQWTAQGWASGVHGGGGHWQAHGPPGYQTMPAQPSWPPQPPVQPAYPGGARPLPTAPLARAHAQADAESVISEVLRLIHAPMAAPAVARAPEPSATPCLSQPPRPHLPVQATPQPGPLQAAAMAPDAADAAVPAGAYLTPVQLALFHEIIRGSGQVPPDLKESDLLRRAEEAMKKAAVAKSVCDFLARQGVRPPRAVGARAKALVSALRSL